MARGQLTATFAMPLPEPDLGPVEEEDSALLTVPGWDSSGPEPGL